MMDFLLMVKDYLVPFVVVLTVLVFVHEFGHYWVARKCGVRVETFSIGFGPELFGRTDKHGTRWKFSLVPLGGYVKMYGDVDPSSSLVSEAAKYMPEEEKRQAFFAKSVGARAAIVAAGPAANYLFAILVLALLFMTAGMAYTQPVAGTVMPDSAAVSAGIQPGDKIVRIDDQPIKRFEDIQNLVALNTGTAMRFVVERNGQPQDITVTPRLTEITDRFGGKHTVARVGIGIATGTDREVLAPLDAFATAASESWRLSISTLQALGQMVMGTRSSEEIGGPLRIAQISGRMSQDGFLAFAWFLALLSINLGLINLFPIPLLDGGHLVFYAAEAIKGKPISERAQEVSFRFGMALVMAMMLFATFNDLVHLEVFSFIGRLFS